MVIENVKYQFEAFILQNNYLTQDKNVCYRPSSFSPRRSVELKDLSLSALVESHVIQNK